MMIYLRIIGATIGGALAAGLVAGVLYAYGNAFVRWSGWAVIGPLVGVLCGCVLAVWAVRGTRERTRQQPLRRAPVRRSPPMSASGLRFVRDVQSAVAEAQQPQEAAPFVFRADDGREWRSDDPTYVLPTLCYCGPDPDADPHLIGIGPDCRRDRDREHD